MFCFLYNFRSMILPRVPHTRGAMWLYAAWALGNSLQRLKKCISILGYEPTETRQTWHGLCAGVVRVVAVVLGWGLNTRGTPLPKLSCNKGGAFLGCLSQKWGGYKGCYHRAGFLLNPDLASWLRVLAPVVLAGIGWDVCRGVVPCGVSGAFYEVLV